VNPSRLVQAVSCTQETQQESLAVAREDAPQPIQFLLQY